MGLINTIRNKALGVKSNVEKSVRMGKKMYKFFDSGLGHKALKEGARLLEDFGNI